MVAKTAKIVEVDQMYHGRYMDVLNQINTENALAETARHNKEIEAAQAAELAEKQRQFNEQMAYTKSKDAAAKKATSSGSSRNYVSTSPKSSMKKPKAKDTSNAVVRPNLQFNSKGTNNNSKNEPTIDIDSVTDLGFGPLNGTQLATLEKQGIIKSYISGNKRKFRMSADGIKQKMLINTPKMERIK